MYRESKESSKFKVKEQRSDHRDQMIEDREKEVRSSKLKRRVQGAGGSRGRVVEAEDRNKKVEIESSKFKVEDESILELEDIIRERQKAQGARHKAQGKKPRDGRSGYNLLTIHDI